MNQQFIKFTSGWIPVSVLLLCAAALVAAESHSRSDSAVHGPAEALPGLVSTLGNVSEEVGRLLEAQGKSGRARPERGLY